MGRKLLQLRTEPTEFTRRKKRRKRTVKLRRQRLLQRPPPARLRLSRRRLRKSLPRRLKRKADEPSEDETSEKIAKLKETAADVVAEEEKKLPEEPLTEAEATA